MIVKYQIKNTSKCTEKLFEVLLDHFYFQILILIQTRKVIQIYAQKSQLL